jgi:hypothetical protein
MLEYHQYDRLAVLQQEPFDSGESHARLNAIKLMPNFERWPCTWRRRRAPATRDSGFHYSPLAPVDIPLR